MLLSFEEDKLQVALYIDGSNSQSTWTHLS